MKPYSEGAMDHGGPPCHQTQLRCTVIMGRAVLVLLLTKGKYFWDPDDEVFLHLEGFKLHCRRIDHHRERYKDLKTRWQETGFIKLHNKLLYWVSHLFFFNRSWHDSSKCCNTDKSYKFFVRSQDFEKECQSSWDSKKDIRQKMQ